MIRTTKKAEGPRLKNQAKASNENTERRVREPDEEQMGKETKTKDRKKTRDRLEIGK